MYTGADFASELGRELAKGFDAVRIARWSYQTYLLNVHDMEKGLKDKIMDLVLMEEGPQFELSEGEIRALIDELSKPALG